MKRAKGNDKIIWNQKYKILRNSVTAKIRKETIDQNNNRIDEAQDENEVWKIATEIINPKSENNWSMKIDNKLTEDPEEIANTFNSYFVQKIVDLKANIDPNLIIDPLSKLKQICPKGSAALN